MKQSLPCISQQIRESVEGETIVTGAGKEVCFAEINSTNPNKKSKKQSTFLYQWKREFLWLKFIIEMELVKLAAEKLVEGFPGPFKKETFTWHGKSKTHCDSVIYDNVTKNPASSQLALCVKEIKKSMFEHLTHLFHISYFIGTNEEPFTHFHRQVALAQQLNVQI